MRTSTLKYLYLQKPVTMVVVLCILSVLPWLGLGEFYTKGEPREASVAVSMIESGNWILPEVYANEVAYKPPMMHWLISAFSYPQGYVSEFTSRLPSALALIAMVAFALIFFGKRVKFQQAFIAALLLITAFETHRAGMTARVDMLLACFMFIGMIQLFRWEEKQELKGLPILIPLLLSCAVLTKGPVGVLLPLLVFGIYLFVLGYPLHRILKAVFYAGFSSLFIPFIWYYSAWEKGGSDFLNIFLAENFGRFFSSNPDSISYTLGHEKPFYYNFLSLLGGFMPWTIMLFFSLFGIHYARLTNIIPDWFKNMREHIKQTNKVKLFSTIAILVIFIFYTIPSSKRSVYLLPMYPFLALYISQYFIYITEYRTFVTRAFASFMSFISGITLIAIVASYFGVFNISHFIESFTRDSKTLFEVFAVNNALQKPDAISWTIFILLLGTFITLIYELSKKNNLKILYATIALTFAINLFIDGDVMRPIKNATSLKDFTERIQTEYPLKNNLYTVNNLLRYQNIYALNFYSGNELKSIALDSPENGYFIIGNKDFEKVRKDFPQYQFSAIDSTATPFNEIEQTVVLYQFTK